MPFIAQIYSSSYTFFSQISSAYLLTGARSAILAGSLSLWMPSTAACKAPAPPPGVPHHRPLLHCQRAAEEPAGLQAAGELLQVGVVGGGELGVVEPVGDWEGHLADVDVGGEELGGWSEDGRRGLIAGT